MARLDRAEIVFAVVDVGVLRVCAIRASSRVTVCVLTTSPPTILPVTAQYRVLSGYWISVVTEYWHLRMLMPPKGDYRMLPLTGEARRLADAWDPGDDAGNECRSYGAAAIMRLPGRLRIQWADDETLRIDIDSGTQTRLLHFDETDPRHLTRPCAVTTHFSKVDDDSGWDPTPCRVDHPR